MDHDWGDWPDQESYAHDGDDASADLGGTDEPLSGASFDGIGHDDDLHPVDGYDQPDVHSGLESADYPDDDPMGGYPGGEPDEPGYDLAADADAGQGALEGLDTHEPVGADPDLVTATDDGWGGEFPEQLELDPPEPVDGFPWTDSSLLGDGSLDHVSFDAAHTTPAAEDLLDYAGMEAGADPWTALLTSDDPAASALARWWAPGG